MPLAEGLLIGSNTFIYAILCVVIHTSPLPVDEPITHQYTPLPKQLDSITNSNRYQTLNTPLREHYTENESCMVDPYVCGIALIEGTIPCTLTSTHTPSALNQSSMGLHWMYISETMRGTTLDY